MTSRLGPDFYRREDVTGIARDLLGTVLHTANRGAHTAVVITETEAYAGTSDRASHAFGGRRTPRTAPMYAPGGIAYVYLCYGIHHLFNVVTGPECVPHAVLIRAGVPLAGVATMRRRRGPGVPAGRLANGPGSLAQALGISTSMSGVSLAGPRIWIEEGDAVDPARVVRGPRVGVGYAGADAELPYRFRLLPGK